MEHNAGKSLTERIALVRNGDNDAFEALVNEYKPMIDSVISRFSLDERDAFSEACIGFYRAARMIETLEMNGWIGEPQGAQKQREIKISREEFETIKDETRF